MKRILLAALLGGLSVTCPAVAPDADYSDLWWNPAESGWGAGLQRQGDVIFLTLFVYGADGANTWLVAPDVRPQAGGSAMWSGRLYRATGPGFAAPYDAIAAAEAGSASLEFDSDDTATLRYSAGGAQVTKRITRMTWREPSAAGRYHGGFSASVASCVDPTRVGAYDFMGPMTVTQDGRQIVASLSSGSTGIPSTCTFTGTSSHAGRNARWSGTFACTIVIGLDGRGEAVATTSRRGTFSVERMAISAHGVYGSLAAADQDCAFTGKFGGTRIP